MDVTTSAAFSTTAWWIDQNPKGQVVIYLDAEGDGLSVECCLDAEDLPLVIARLRDYLPATAEADLAEHNIVLRAALAAQWAGIHHLRDHQCAPMVCPEAERLLDIADPLLDQARALLELPPGRS